MTCDAHHIMSTEKRLLEGEVSDPKKPCAEPISTENAAPVSIEPKRDEYTQDSRDKGYAAIKPEFVLESCYISEYNDDEAEDEGRGAQEQPKKRRGQNKKRDLVQHVDLRLCTSLLDPANPGVCNFGPDKCRNTHDIEKFLESKLPDIEGVCPVFDVLGYCPTGIKCRWLLSHYDSEKKALRTEPRSVGDNYEINKIDSAHKTMLMKKKYVFNIADKVVPFIDSLVNHENLPQQKAQNPDDAVNTANAAQEQTKDNAASYVEPPYSLAEKKRIHLGNAKIVSPLTTVGNLPYRRLMKTLGADVTYSEMALSVPLLQGHNAEWALPKAHKLEYPGFGVQIALAKHAPAARAAEAIYRETSNVSEINLNCGCPIDLLYRQGMGSALMDQPARLVRVLKAMNASSGDIPITLKIRTGTKDSKQTAKQLVERVLEEGDVAAITMHGRSRQQRYTKEANWDYISQVGGVVKQFNELRAEKAKDKAEARPVWFVGNGDVFTHEDWYNAVSQPGIDSVMVARGALIKPWIFEEVEAQQYLDKSATERLEMLKTYAKFAVEHWGSDEYGLCLARRFMCEFIGFTHRYIPVGILERLPPRINERPPQWKGRNELETLLGLPNYKDWIKITEMFLGKAGPLFNFTPKHKSNAY